MRSHQGSLIIFAERQKKCFFIYVDESVYFILLSFTS